MSSRLLILGCLAVGGAGLTSAARASSPDAWTSLAAEVTSACKAVSQLKSPRPAGALVGYDDTVGWTALLLKGRYPQPHMKNRAGRELCLFDRKTRQAHVVEADQLTGTQR
ncbi:MAG: hypothetical protein EOP38_20380 [Rubrivivax sp.]|nr:MAG: hypothetical protein EOP38_20380 [Rubrivivax sp.]